MIVPAVVWADVMAALEERDRLREALEAAEERLETIYASRDPERMTQEAYFGLQEITAFHTRPAYDEGGPSEKASR